MSVVRKVTHSHGRTEEVGNLLDQLHIISSDEGSETRSSSSIADDMSSNEKHPIDSHVYGRQSSIIKPVTSMQTTNREKSGALRISRDYHSRTPAEHVNDKEYDADTSSRKSIINLHEISKVPSRFGAESGIPNLALLAGESGSDYDAIDSSHRPAIDSSHRPAIDRDIPGTRNLIVRNKVRQVEELEGFCYASTENFQKRLSEIITWKMNHGFYVSDTIQPQTVKGVSTYLPGVHFVVEKKLYGTKDSSLGVYLCCDMYSKQRFIMKRIAKYNTRLIGLEFLARHFQPFLPKIYGVYKEEMEVVIFMEYIEGSTLEKITNQWNVREVRLFAEFLLSAFKYLHCHDLVHGDVKLSNIMIRDPTDPTSHVIIDFQSAKHAQCKYRGFEGTIVYLPPWYQRLFSLTSYDDILKAADLWAIACVLINFLIPRNDHDLRKVPSYQYELWGVKRYEIRQQCSRCKDTKYFCDDHCKVRFLKYVGENGHNILTLHLGCYMEMQTEDEDWQRLKDLLIYLTNPAVESINVSRALQIVTGSSTTDHFQCPQIASLSPNRFIKS